MYALVVRLAFHDADAAVVFDRLVADVAARIADHEPGTLLYATHAPVDIPEMRVIYEVYRDRDAFEEHQRQPHTRNFLEQRDNYVATTTVEFLTTLTFDGHALRTR